MDAIANKVVNEDRLNAMIGQIRITSYNVCYTKLLRDLTDHRVELVFIHHFFRNCVHD